MRVIDFRHWGQYLPQPAGAGLRLRGKRPYHQETESFHSMIPGLIFVFSGDELVIKVAGEDIAIQNQIFC